MLAFTEPLSFQGNDVLITYAGKVTGDEIKFTRDVGEFATEELVAKREVNARKRRRQRKPAMKK